MRDSDCFDCNTATNYHICNKYFVNEEKDVNVNLKDGFYRIDWKVEIIALATSGALSSLYLAGSLLFQFHQFKSSNARTLQF